MKRLLVLAGQIEKLSWMLEWMEDQQMRESVTGCPRVVRIRQAEAAWNDGEGL